MAVGLEDLLRLAGQQRRIQIGSICRRREASDQQKKTAPGYADHGVSIFPLGRLPISGHTLNPNLALNHLLNLNLAPNLNLSWHPGLVPTKKE
jgi:hypothetical protein